MDDSEFDIELAKLYSAERKKEYYYLVSVEQERQAVISAFYDHYVSVSAFQDVTTVDDFLSSFDSLVGEPTGKLETSDDDDDDDDDFLSPIAAELNDLIQKDIESFDVLLDGEMQISGDGIYMVSPDEGGVPDVEILEQGATLVGDIQWYSVAPMIPYELFMRTQNDDNYEQPTSDDVTNEMPGVWLLMSNAVLTDENGANVSEHEQVLVPLNYPSLSFNKVMRQKEALIGNVQDIDIEQVPVESHFKSDFMLEICNDIENDLNHNDYEGEEAHEMRARHQEELSIYMSGVDREALLCLSAFTATMLDGNEAELTQQAVHYVDTVIMHVNGTWRIVHAFETTPKDGKINIAHVLPEFMTEIRLKDQ